MATLVPQKDDVEHWTVEQVAAWLQQVELSDCCDTFLRRGIDGHGFLQLSRDELLRWGSDVSLRNFKQILRLVSQIKHQQQHPGSTRQSIEIYSSLEYQPPKTCNEYEMNFPVKDFFGEEETEEFTWQEQAPPPPPIPPRHQGQSPGQVVASSFPRTNTGQNTNLLRGTKSCTLETHNNDIWNDNDSFSDEDEVLEHPSQKMQLGKEDDQGEENIDDLYLVPLPASSPTTSLSSLINRELPSHPQLPTNTSFIHQHGGGSWNQSKVKKERFNFGSDVQNNRRSNSPAILERTPGRPPPTLNDTLMPYNKSPLHHFQGSAPNRALHTPLQEAINHNLVENGSSGVKGASFPRHQFPSSSPSRWQDSESSQTHLPTQSTEKNDHVYEVVDVPQGSYGGTEAPSPNKSDQQSPSKPPIPPPRNQNQDSDDRDLSSRLGPLSLSHGKRPPAPLPPPVGNNLSEGRHISQARPPALDLPNRSDRSKQPAPPPFSGYSSHSSHQSFPKESHALPELSLNSSASSQPFINLGNGEHIELTPLYRKIMEKPYFQFISRAKAKELVMQGKEGAFLIRPSTRTKMPLTLTVKHNDRYYNINIRQRPDCLFALGYEKPSERTFSSIDEMVSTYLKEPITLVNGKCALLKYSPSKPVCHVPNTH